MKKRVVDWVASADANLSPCHIGSLQVLAG